MSATEEGTTMNGVPVKEVPHCHFCEKGVEERAYIVHKDGIGLCEVCCIQVAAQAMQQHNHAAVELSRLYEANQVLQAKIDALKPRIVS